MTTRQKQALLAYLGCYDGPLDGLWGEKSQLATIDFQRAYMEPTAVDGIFGAATEKRILEVIATGEEPRESVKVDTAPGFWKDIRYFTRAEFRCPCGKCGGFPVEPDETLVRLADQVREHFGAPATVSSGVRCQAHNDELPNSVPNSYHVKGKAMDFCVRGVSGAKLLAYVKTLPVHYAYQINRSDFVHMDVN
ncbi:MAG: D-Ala-D-Ala carboxypeptidase family metallohydrolase [Candidatus Faecousia sp.]|nr:D-Ala-D-Ala carboxypeptidase family metallohydrolase [Candidatus Faecousia sp.]